MAGGVSIILARSVALPVTPRKNGEFGKGVRH
jgi:hypothetical protein